MVKWAVFAASVVAAAAHGEATGFLGNWTNQNPGRGGLTHLVISPDGGDRVVVRAYGECHPNECDWGLQQAKVYTDDPKSKRVEAIAVTFHYGFAHHEVILRPTAGGELQYELFTEFADGSDKRDFMVAGTLQPSSWAGPLAQNWVRPAELRTGWGGGARDFPARPAEHCVPFETSRARAVEANGNWRIVAGSQVLADAGNDGSSAVMAEAAIHHYGFDRRCTVGGPFKTYWKTGVSFSSDQMGGAQCIGFNPTTVHLVRMEQEWKIVDGSTWILDLGGNKPKADAMLAFIRANGLTKECFIRQGDPVMVFWLTH